jgi:hypothetical protein
MVWNLMFWFAVAYLGVAIIWRYFVPAFRRSKPSSDSDKRPSGAERFFARGQIVPTVAIVFMAAALIVRANPDLIQSKWSENQKEQLGHFSEAMSLYDQATQIASYHRLSADDWESVKALLEASQSEAAQVSDTVLAKLDGELPAHFHDEFLRGLQTGIFGLTQYNQGAPKGTDTLRYNAADSLKIGRELLDQWDDWYLPRQATLAEKIGPVIHD